MGGVLAFPNSCICFFLLFRITLPTHLLATLSSRVSAGRVACTTTRTGATDFSATTGRSFYRNVAGLVVSLVTASLAGLISGHRNRWSEMVKRLPL
jgi:ABC-type nitrate/sulfonate/bicarbonate transport system permease component